MPWQFAAAQAFIAEKQPVLASSIIEYLQSQPLTPVQKNSLNLLTADNLYLLNELDEAQKALDKIDDKQLSEFGLNYYLKLQTHLHIDKEKHLEASDTLFLLIPLLKTDLEKQQYNDLLLTQLSFLPVDFLSQFQVMPETAEQQATSELEFAEQQLDAALEITAVDPEQQFKEGWYALAYLYQRYQLRPQSVISLP